MRNLIVGRGMPVLIGQYGYPAEACLETVHPTSASLYYPQAPDERYRCDMSYVSHCSRPPEKHMPDLLQRWRRPLADRGLDINEVAEYVVERARRMTFVDHRPARLLSREMLTTYQQARKAAEIEQRFWSDLFNLHDAVFRQAALEAISSLDVDLRIYGAGWADHPRLSRFSAGVAANGHELRRVYCSSRINLQLIGSSPLHPRLTDGLFCEAFFLVAAAQPTADLARRLPILQAIVEHNPRSIEQLDAILRDEQRLILQEFRTHQERPIAWDMTLVNELRGEAFTVFQAVFGDWPQVVFTSHQELLDKVQHFLGCDDQRAEIARQMAARARQVFGLDAFVGDVVSFLRDRCHVEANA
jgi:hypothetical protein